jgi:general secretion pathway protein A
VTYLDFYGLADFPFSLTSNPRYLYASRAFARTWTDVTSAVARRAGIIVITGESGTGKTLMCRALLEQLGPDTLLSAIADPHLSADDLLRQILTDFGASGDEANGAVPDRSADQLLASLENFFRKRDLRDNHAIVLIDEAQHLRAAVLELIQRLNTFEADNGKRLQILLVGPPELYSKLHRSLLRSFSQRVACWATLLPFDRDEVGPCLTRRLEVAGADGKAVEFVPAAIDALAGGSQGNPRFVNVIADHALQVGFARRSHAIDESIVREAIERSGLLLSARSGLTPARAAVAGASLAVVLVAALAVVQPWPFKPALAPTEAAPAAPVSEPKPAQALPPDGILSVTESHLVTLGPYETADQAADLAGRIGSNGLPAFTRRAAPDKYVVLIGPYVTMREAIEVQQRIEALRYQPTQIVIE